MYNLNAGRLRNKVTFMHYVDSVDDYGRDVQVLEEFKTVWAEVRPMRGFEYLEYYREKNKVQTKVTCRYFSEVNEDMVVRFNEKLHEITAIIDVENLHSVLEIMVQERVGEDKNGGDSSIQP